MSVNIIKINLSSIKHNFNIIQKTAGSQTRIMAIVKSDAYGHGLIHVAQTLEDAGCEYFGVFETEEGVSLRKAGINKPILVLMGILKDDIDELLSNNLTSALYNLDAAKDLSEKALKRKTRAHVHIKIDTGMGRLGVSPDEFHDFYEKVSKLPGLSIDGFFSHFSASDDSSNPFTEKQLKQFEKLLGSNNLFLKRNHIANSSGIFRKNGLAYPIARAGISLYGSSPLLYYCHKNQLKQVMTFHTKIINLKTVAANTPISYGLTYYTKKQSRIATIPVGYDDGFNRLLSNKGEVLIRGKRAPIVGRVCMNLTMVDVTHIENAEIHDEVILMGKQGSECITADEIAEKIGTISYEVFCIFGKCNVREYKSSPG